jgi:hypothetical protein
VTSPPAPQYVLVRRKPRGTVRVLFSLVALVLAPLSWWWSIDDPLLRSTGITVWMMLGSALFLSISAAVRDRRGWIRAVAAAEVGLALLAVWAFFGFARLPYGSVVERLPDFTLLDHTGTPVTLSAELARGPVLLVFYRGHW